MQGRESGVRITSLVLVLLFILIDLSGLRVNSVGAPCHARCISRPTKTLGNTRSIVWKPPKSHTEVKNANGRRKSSVMRMACILMPFVRQFPNIPLSCRHYVHAATRIRLASIRSNTLRKNASQGRQASGFTAVRQRSPRPAINACALTINLVSHLYTYLQGRASPGESHNLGIPCRRHLLGWTCARVLRDVDIHPAPTANVLYGLRR